MASSKEYINTHREAIREYNRGWRRRKYASDPIFRAKIREAQRKKYAEDPEFRRKQNQARADWASRNPDRDKLAGRRGHLKTYGLTPEDYERMLNEQKGTCAVCHCPPFKHRMIIDHDHKTGKVRGLLCHRCNSALGHARDSSDRLRLLATYLDKFVSV